MLLDALRANDKKGLFTSDDVFTTYSTGLLPLDYANGSWMRIKKEDGTEESVPLLGIVAGTYTTIIGGTGCGKTTLADQMGYNVIKPFEDGIMIHKDCEQTALKPRIVQITSRDPNYPNVLLDKTAVSIEDTIETINKICEAKEQAGDAAKYPVEDPVFGTTNLIYVPTVIIIDSLPSFNSKDMAGIGNNNMQMQDGMAVNREVKDISQFYAKQLYRMNKYNINIIAVNHIKANPSAGMIGSPQVQGLMMLRQGETCPRGTAPMYYAQNVFRCNMVKSSFYDPDDVGFSGSKIVIQIAKSKTTFVGSSVSVAFNSATGFDPIFTMYEFANDIGLIEGRNPYLYLHGMESFKFKRNQFRDKFINDTAFREGFMEICQPYLESLLGSKELTESDKLRYGDLNINPEDYIIKSGLDDSFSISDSSKGKKKKK